VKGTAKDAMAELLVNALKLALTSMAYVQLNDSVTRITGILQIRRGDTVADPE
jgi:hypothetical protein